MLVMHEAWKEKSQREEKGSGEGKAGRQAGRKGSVTRLLHRVALEESLGIHSQNLSLHTIRKLFLHS